MAMINDGITRGIMIDFRALKKRFPTNETYIASLLDHASSLDDPKMTPRIRPAITPKNVAMVNAFVRRKDVHPFSMALNCMHAFESMSVCCYLSF